MPIRIAIPEPSSDAEYNGRSLQPYLDAVTAVGGEAIVIGLGESAQSIAATLEGTQGVLLPGSRFDVDPESYGERRLPECGPADAAREAMDGWLLKDAFETKKPVLAICYGIQSLNVWRGGMLIQHVQTPVNHTPGRDVVAAHGIRIQPGSRLAELVSAGEAELPSVNSSHHQAVRQAGDGLIVTAISPVDGVVEAVELEAAEHFVLGVQWHPERTCGVSALSDAIFAAFIGAARVWQAASVGRVAAGPRPR